ncbi:hypothetical protein FACS18948_2430 [Clostridia bacterium]|nr:hypothetical protein FACS18948_2430 [Clostridia bacterium]
MAETNTADNVKHSVFATRLYEFRMRNNFTQQRLAQLVGVTQQSIWKWETDRSEPNIEKLRRLSELFRVPTDVLLGLQDLPDSSARQTNTESRANMRGRKARRIALDNIGPGTASLVHVNDLERVVRGLVSQILASSDQKESEPLLEMEERAAYVQS